MKLKANYRTLSCYHRELPVVGWGVGESPYLMTKISEVKAHGRSKGTLLGKKHEDKMGFLTREG